LKHLVGFRRRRVQSRDRALSWAATASAKTPECPSGSGPQLGSFEESMASRGEPRDEPGHGRRACAALEIGAGHETAAITRPLKRAAFAPGEGAKRLPFVPFPGSLSRG